MTTLELQSTSLTTGGAVRVREVSAAVCQPGLTAIVGDNGSGKSSLLSLLAGQIAPTAGRVLLDGSPIDEVAPRERARQVAWLGQSTPGAEIFSARDVVRWGSVSHQRGRASALPDPSEVLEEFGLTDLLNAPLGSLSGGERQRVHLARIWTQAAPVTLLDEPDASLDDSGRLLLRSMIAKRVSEGDCLVIATHDRVWAHSMCDFLWVMAAGRLTAQ